MWNVTDFQKVVFSDKSRFVLGTDDNRVRMWRLPGPFLNGLPGAIFQQHNDRPHTARVAQDFLGHFQTSMASPLPRFVPCRARVGSSKTADAVPDGRGYELVSSVRALVPQKFSVEEELMHVKHVEVKSPHVGVMWKLGRGVISSEPLQEKNNSTKQEKTTQSRQQKRNNLTQQEKTTHLVSRNETTQLSMRNNSTQHEKQLTSAAGTKQLNSALPSTAVTAESAFLIYILT
ncbi:transposable element Tcb2 transposase [Trichonephila clavipes]|nr:transposable element Tcb2 transposase [Trichonephila clavipes]